MLLRRNPLLPSDHPTGRRNRCPIPAGVIPTAGLMAGVLLAVAPASLAQQVPSAKVLYRLSTQCALQGAAPVPCTVEAVDSGGATLYRHRIGTSVETVRITAEPVTMAIWAHDARNWRPLRGASARFSTNTVCFNGKDLCVVNPNYLNSVREDRANTRLQGRDLVMVHFGSDGRVDASCYDDACALLLK
ncbi:hypothetical protein VB738_15175 [Cyanobium gracile UHCC 0139]|uniref:Uncharacterized protein n=1 Tax=Cyanobium gracile UHCC 0139 TaxID=3110308 RepID=A0ABU5RXX0_9CYAN|nr:hypothetical protein [Cyanobium gracile]MEA5392604.1 hypothetical protein [Cyanobium gracile UHCC 0139]